MRHHIRRIGPGLTRILWISVGSLALFLGALGVILPVLPTTPFVILAAFCFGRSAPRFHAWLAGHRLFGPIISDWQAEGAIAPRYKTIATGMMAAAFGFSLWMQLPPMVLWVQAACLICAATYVLSRPNGPR
ncbi:YbaN family protein [Roseovarius aestuarii]|nr:YbaN family protein [Roseovarius aestuarii]